LVAAAAQLAERVSADPDLTLPDLAYTLSQRRSHLNYRHALVADSITQAREQLLALAEGRQLSAGRISPTPPKLAFVCTGMGPQWWKMCRGLLDVYPAFTDSTYQGEPIREASYRVTTPAGSAIVTVAETLHKRALARRQANFAARAKLDPRLKCWVLGVPRSVYYPAPFQILQRAADLTLVHQFGDQVRTIHTDGSKHTTEEDPELYLGDSRGHWEGDTLVVDVTGFNEETWLDRAGNYHSEQLHVVERWRTIYDGKRLEVEVTAQDHKAFTTPWKATRIWQKVDRGLMLESVCAENNINPFNLDEYPMPEAKTPDF